MKRQNKVEDSSLRSGKQSSFRRRLFTLITISLPVVFFLCLELGLRIFGYGVNVSLFRRVEIRHQTYLQMNPDVKYRYFGTLKFKPTTSPQYFKDPKPPGVFRVFCMGGSTTVGFPYSYNGSFPEFLAERLHALFPQKKIEVINLGMTATNSITVLDLAKEAVHYQPDLIVDYDGHNEFYGALGAASNQTVGSSRTMINIYLMLVHLRTFQLLRNTINDITRLLRSGHDEVSRGTLMEILAHGEYIPQGSRLYNKTFRTFKDNLESLAALCNSRGIPLILCTQVSDLRDQRPLFSSNSPGISEPRKAVFLKFFNGGVAMKKAGFFDSAAASFRLSLAEDSLYADAHYMLAQCLESAGQTKEALREYLLARDCDELRFRADTKFNDLIRSMRNERGTYVADVEEYFMENSPDSLVGHNLIMEHLHPDSHGNFLIAKCVAEAMQRNGILSRSQDWAAADTLSDAYIWNLRRVTEFDEMFAQQITRYLTSGWPFENRSPEALPVSPNDTLQYLAQKAALGQLHWDQAHKEAIEFYERRGDYRQAALEYSALISMFPMDLQLYMDLGREYLKQNRLDDLQTAMMQSLEIYPTLQAYRTLGDLMLERGNVDGAVEYYSQMDGFIQPVPERVRNGVALSYAYYRAGRIQEARSELLKVLATDPQYRPAIQLLQLVNTQAGKSRTGDR